MRRRYYVLLALALSLLPELRAHANRSPSGARASSRRRHLRRADRDQHHDGLGRYATRRRHWPSGSPRRAFPCGGRAARRHPSRTSRTWCVRSARHRGKGEPILFLDRTSDVVEARREDWSSGSVFVLTERDGVFLRARHLGHQGRGGGPHRQPDPPQERAIRPPAATSSSPSRTTRRVATTTGRLAARAPARADPRGLRDQHGRGRRPDAERPAARAIPVQTSEKIYAHVHPGGHRARAGTARCRRHRRRTRSTRWPARWTGWRRSDSRSGSTNPRGASSPAWRTRREASSPPISGR